MSFLTPAGVAAMFGEMGIDFEWHHRSPCGCGSPECMVAVPDDAERYPGEVHLRVAPGKEA